MLRIALASPVVVLVALAATSCSTARLKVDSRPALEPSPALPGFERLSLERTGCYGTCPAYKVVVYADGRVEYTGAGHVLVTGMETAALSLEKVDDLSDALREANFSSLQDSYASVGDGCPTLWTDCGLVITSVTVSGAVKTIRHDYGCRYSDTTGHLGPVYPFELTRFESAVDEIVGTGQWVGVEVEPGGETRLPAPN